LHPVGNRLAGCIGGGKAEIGQFVVQQETFHHLTCAKGVFNGGCHGQRVALRVDDADVAGAVFGLCRHRRPGRFHAARLARLCHFHRLAAGPLRDQLGAVGQIGGRQQAHPVAGRRLHKGGVGHVQRPVGKGQARGLGVQVEPVGRRQAALQRQRGGVCLRQDAQDLPDRQRA